MCIYGLNLPSESKLSSQGLGPRYQRIQIQLMRRRRSRYLQTFRWRSENGQHSWWKRFAKSPQCCCQFLPFTFRRTTSSLLSQPHIELRGAQKRNHEIEGFDGDTTKVSGSLSSSRDLHENLESGSRNWSPSQHQRQKPQVLQKGADRADRKHVFCHCLLGLGCFAQSVLQVVRKGTSANNCMKWSKFSRRANQPVVKPKW